MTETNAAETNAAETSTRTVHYPGVELPAAPRFTLDVPDGYVAHPASGLLAIVEPATRHEPFQPNVTVVADLVPAGADPATVLDRIVAETVDAHPGSSPGARETTTVPGADGVGDMSAASQYIRIAAPLGPVEQVLAVYVVPARLPGDITYAFTVASTWAAEESSAEESSAGEHSTGEHSAVLRRIHESFRIGGFVTEPAD